MNREKELTKQVTAYEAGMEFYRRKIGYLSKQISDSPDPENFITLLLVEELETSELKIKHLIRRKEMGLIE